MNVQKEIKTVMPRIIAGLARCWNCPVGLRLERGLNLAGQSAVVHVLEDLISVLFPGCRGRSPASRGPIEVRLRRTLQKAARTLEKLVRWALEFRRAQEGDGGTASLEQEAREAVVHLVRSLPEIQRILQQDIVAAYEGDPAARSTMEVVMSYPGVYAVIVHRIAHLLYEKGIPLIPRIMSEHAHSLTGIDIHPGARIGPGFFVDHGTGVVIGETCVIGRNVKLYQGVTLGALSFEKDRSGRLVKGIKRHPDVGDNVVIYAGATILGGRTVIGSGSVIGGNVWLTRSVPPGSRVYNRQPEPLIRRGRSARRARMGEGQPARTRSPAG